MIQNAASAVGILCWPVVQMKQTHKLFIFITFIIATSSHSYLHNTTHWMVTFHWMMTNKYFIDKLIRDVKNAYDNLW